jgi:hypothetical protein
MRVATIQRDLAVDLLQMQPAEAVLTSVGCDEGAMARVDRAPPAPLAAAIAAE